MSYRNIGKTFSQAEYDTCTKVPVVTSSTRYEQWHTFLDEIKAEKWLFSYGELWFTNANDALLFKLRFGHHSIGA